MVTASDRHLLLCNELAVEGPLISAFLQRIAVRLEDATVVSSSGSLAEDALPQGAFASAVSVSQAAGQHKPALLRALIGALCPGGELVVQEAQGAAGLDVLRKDLLLAGFVDTAASTPVSATPEASAVAVTARKPRWEQGARAAIALKPRSVAAPAPTPPASAPAPAPAASVAVAKAWMLDVDGDGGEELLDDEDLLTEEDRARPAVPVAEDCGVGASKKACANCSCGRAEAEAAGVKTALTLEMLENPQSACGSCGLGDAFRCAGCPYRGLPSFAPGQKIELPADFLSADA